jgi:hypothetical protein
VTRGALLTVLIMGLSSPTRLDTPLRSATTP